MLSLSLFVAHESLIIVVFVVYSHVTTQFAIRPFDVSYLFVVIHEISIEYDSEYSTAKFRFNVGPGGVVVVMTVQHRTFAVFGTTTNDCPPDRRSTIIVA